MMNFVDTMNLNDNAARILNMDYVKLYGAKHDKFGIELSTDILTPYDLCADN